MGNPGEEQINLNPSELSPGRAEERLVTFVSLPSRRNPVEQSYFLSLKVHWPLGFDQILILHPCEERGAQTETEGGFDVWPVINHKGQILCVHITCFTN